MQTVSFSVRYGFSVNISAKAEYRLRFCTPAAPPSMAPLCTRVPKQARIRRIASSPTPTATPLRLLPTVAPCSSMGGSVQSSSKQASLVAGADSATEVDRYFESHGFSAVNPRILTGKTPPRAGHQQAAKLQGYRVVSKQAEWRESGKMPNG